MTYLPSSYTNTDRQDIISGYSTDGTTKTVDLDAIAAAIENQDESVASVEDLLSYYLEMAGTLPEFMTGDLLDPEDPELQALWSDEEFVETVQEWRRENVAEEELTSLISQLEAFLETGYEAGYSACEVDVLSDIDDLIDEWYETHESTSDSEDEDTVTLTDAVAIAMKKWGNPGLAILFYIMGSTVTEEDEETGEETTYKNTGLGEVVQEFQETAIENYEDLQEEIDELVDDLGDVDYSDTEAANAEVEEIKRRMSVAENVSKVYSELIEMSQGILDSLVETASSLIDRQFRTQSSVINRM